MCVCLHDLICSVKRYTESGFTRGAPVIVAEIKT